jgi:hypothetical protein
MRPSFGAHRPSMSPQPWPSQIPSPQSASVLHALAPPLPFGCSTTPVAGPPGGVAAPSSDGVGFVPSVVVGPTGFHVSTSREHASIPLREGKLDFEALDLAIAHIRADETNAVVAFSPEPVDVADVLRTASVLRKKGHDGAKFKTVALAVSADGS